MKKAGIVVAMLLVVTMLVACGGSPSIVGQWEGPDGLLEFTNDGKLIFSEEEFGMSFDAQYEIKDGKLVIEVFGMQEEIEYKLQGDKLTIEDEEYTRKK